MVNSRSRDCGRIVRAVLALVVLSILLGLSHAALAQQAPAKKAEAQSATVGAARADEWWVKRFNSFNERVKQGNADLIFVGDSITQGWEGDGKDVWAQYYAKRNAVNLGIGGDRTQQVLYRLDNGNVDGINPKLAVLMIGTNNMSSNTAKEIGAGIKAVVKKLRKKLPTTKVLVLAVFPRGEKPFEGREKLAKASAIAKKTADNKNVFFMDIGKEFLSADGTLSKDIMPDFLHLTPKGYEIWAKAIEPKVARLMGE